MSDNCVHSATNIWVTSAIILNTILLAIILYVIFKFRQRNPTISNAAKHTKLLYYFGFAFFLISFITLLLYLIATLLYCSDMQLIWIILYALYTLSYAVQLYSLLLLLFFRIHWIFKSTMFAFSKYILQGFKILFIVTPLLFVASICVYNLNRMHGTIMVGISFLVAIVLVVSITILFVRKLIHVYQNRDNEELLTVITKTTILTFCSIFITALTNTSVIIANVIIISIHSLMISHIIAMFDMFSNFMFIALTYKCFQKEYNILFGFIDIKCRNLCYKAVKQQMNDTQSSTTNE
eukprot:20686_1